MEGFPWPEKQRRQIRKKLKSIRRGESKRERERESVCSICDVGSWKSRGLQNKQAACLRLPCDVTIGQTGDEGRRERNTERERKESERDAHWV